MDSGFALDGYVIEELIGFGGTGEVWRAREAATGDAVALKRLRVRGPAATEQLRREGAVLAAVAGPHVVGVRGLVVEGDDAVLVMDHAAGGSLASVIAGRGALPAVEAVTILAPMAAALAAAHARDLVHGDLTPANILFTADGRPLLADFGLSRVLGTMPQQVEGTPDFVDPSVLDGGPVTAASDVFALGVVGFTVLAGASPWGSGPTEEVVERVRADDRSPLASVAALAPAALVEVIEAMLSRDPHDRPDSRSVASAVLRSGAAAPVGLVTAIPPVPPPVTRQLLIRGIEQPSRPGAAGSGPSVSPSAWSSTGPGTPRSASRSGAPSAPGLAPAPASWAGRPLGPDRTDRPSAVLGEIEFEPDDETPSPMRRRLLVTGGAAVAIAVAAAIGVGSTRLFGGAGQAAAAPPRAAAGGVDGRAAAGLEPAAARSGGGAAVAPGAGASARSSPTPRSSWTAVVAQLDARRARAFALAQPALLAAVYAPGVSAYSADLTTVQSLASRGLRAQGFAATVVQVDVEGGTATTERLRVVDRLAGYALVDSSGAVVGQGAARAARAFSMTLTAVAGEWRVSAVTPL